MRKLLILGATGSIGTTCLNELERNNPGFEVCALTANTNNEKLTELGKKFHSATLLTSKATKEEIVSFIDSVKPDITLNAVMGSDGLFYTCAALDSGSDVALANKESVVMGGKFLFNKANWLNRRIIPVDSEHSALYNLIGSNKRVKKLYITASGGPFLRRENLENATLTEALNHPTWKMGNKITIDSATLANKGLEVIEASYLFNFSCDDIEVVIHPESVVHSLIQTFEGDFFAELSPPDMTLPIMKAISDGKIPLNGVVRTLSFDPLALHFERPDLKKFEMLALAYEALGKGGSYPILYNASNEVAVNLFLEGKIYFQDIMRIVKEAFSSDFSQNATSLDEIYAQHERAVKITTNISQKFLS